jgi:hypothetical protein
LQNNRDAVQSAIDSGATHSTLNLSQGASQLASVVDLDSFAGVSIGDCHDSSLPAQAQANAANVVSNFAKAFDLDKDKLLSADPQVAGAERAKLQQALMDRVHSASASDPQLKAVKTAYDETVHTFTSQGNNSVIVAAGNDGLRLSQMAQLNGGTQVRPPAGLIDNILVDDDAFAVGATTSLSSKFESIPEQRADYSSNYPGVHGYANGDVRSDVAGTTADTNPEGTSFAAPRWAADTEAIHRNFPNMNDKQVQAMMIQQFTHQEQDGEGTMNVLDQDRLDTFLSHNTH